MTIFASENLEASTASGYRSTDGICFCCDKFSAPICSICLHLVTSRHK